MQQSSLVCRKLPTVSIDRNCARNPKQPAYEAKPWPKIRVGKKKERVSAISFFTFCLYVGIGVPKRFPKQQNSDRNPNKKCCNTPPICSTIYASNLNCRAFGATELSGKGNTVSTDPIGIAVHLPFGHQDVPKKMHLGLQTPRPATEPRNPETPKVHFKVRKMPFGSPEKWPQKSN